MTHGINLKTWKKKRYFSIKCGACYTCTYVTCSVLEIWAVTGSCSSFIVTVTIDWTPRKYGLKRNWLQDVEQLTTVLFNLYIEKFIKMSKGISGALEDEERGPSGGTQEMVSNASLSLQMLSWILVRVQWIQRRGRRRRRWVTCGSDKWLEGGGDGWGGPHGSQGFHRGVEDQVNHRRRGWNTESTSFLIT